MESPLEKIQSFYNDELQVLIKKLESKNNINNQLIETKENIGNKAVQPNALPIPKCHLEVNSNDAKMSKIKEIIVTEINNTSNNQKDSQPEMNYLEIINYQLEQNYLYDQKTINKFSLCYFIQVVH